MNITIKLKDVYGTTKAYPLCDTAKLFAAMLGTTTLTERSLKYIQLLGYDIHVENIGMPAGVLSPLHAGA